MQSGWMDADSSWNGMEAAWPDLTNTWVAMSAINGGVANSNGGVGGNAGNGGGGSSDWPGVPSGDWNPSRCGGTDSDVHNTVNGDANCSGNNEGASQWGGWQDFAADKADNEWGVPDNWGIEPPPPYLQNLLVEDTAFEAHMNGMGGGLGDRKSGGGGGGGGMMFGSFNCSNGCLSNDDFMCVSDANGGGGIGSSRGQSTGGDGSDGLESDPIDFDIDGLLSSQGQDPSVGGDGSNGGNDSDGSPFCPGLSCFQQPQQGGLFLFM